MMDGSVKVSGNKMEEFECNNDPFKYPYGILYTLPDGGPWVKSYLTEEDRDEYFDKAMETAMLRIQGKLVQVKNMVKFKAEGPTYRAKSESND